MFSHSNESIPKRLGKIGVTTTAKDPGNDVIPVTFQLYLYGLCDT